MKIELNPKALFTAILLRKTHSLWEKLDSKIVDINLIIGEVIVVGNCASRLRLNDVETYNVGDKLIFSSKDAIAILIEEEPYYLVDSFDIVGKFKNKEINE